jgi:hypothetical protein
LEHEFYEFPFRWECHHPMWRSPSFYRGVAQPPTRIDGWSLGDWFSTSSPALQKHRGLSQAQGRLFETTSGPRNRKLLVSQQLGVELTRNWFPRTLDSHSYVPSSG